MSFQYLQRRQASFNTKLPIGLISPKYSASGINSDGEIIPIASEFQRISASAPLHGSPCICQDWDKKNFIFFCTYSIKPLLIFKVQNSLLLLTFSLLPIEEASSFFTTGFLYYSFCLLHCISDKVLTLKHNLYIFVVVNEHLINYVGKYISVILFQHTILG